MSIRNELAQIGARLGDEARGGVIAATDGASDWVVPFGVVDEHGRAYVAADPEHVFPFTSISKPFTAMQVLTLVDEGRLDLHAPVCEYIPEFGAAHKGAVTTAHILSHTSGLDPSANLIEGPPTPLTSDGYLQAAMDVGLITPAGAVFAYCSPTFWVLGELVSRLTGVPYPQHIAERVLKPMGADHAGYRLGQVEGRLVLPRTPPGLEHLPDQTTLVPYPAGGLIGRASDLLAVGRCMFSDGIGARGRVITSAAARLMRRPTATGMIAGRAVRWGLGWELGGPGSLRNDTTLYHGGASGVAIWVDLEAQICATVLTCTWGTPRKVFSEAINGIIGAFGRVS
ncbi:MAG TPA: serine hydrolase domain-containing protein [Solirubrobacteraceae bacterium]|nr:serine hydrolase domain-containing protein [Solirubrobacteraceae bacterium]